MRKLLLTLALGVAADGSRQPNGTDFWWDEGGTGNCWQANTAGAAAVTSDPQPLPDCGAPALFHPSNPVKQAQLLPCATWSREMRTSRPKARARTFSWSRRSRATISGFFSPVSDQMTIAPSGRPTAR